MDYFTRILTGLTDENLFFDTNWLEESPTLFDEEPVKDDSLPIILNGRESSFGILCLVMLAMQECHCHYLF